MFSLLVWLTQMTACTSASVHFNALFSIMLVMSAKPTSEWSVKTVCTAPGIKASTHHHGNYQSDTRGIHTAYVAKTFWPSCGPPFPPLDCLYECYTACSIGSGQDSGDGTICMSCRVSVSLIKQQQWWHLVTERASVEQSQMRHCREGLVCMHHCNLLPDQYASQQCKRTPWGGSRCLIVYCTPGHIVYLSKRQVQKVLAPIQMVAYMPNANMMLGSIQ